MDNNFVADVRLDDNDEVLQLPIVKNRLKKLLTNAIKKIAMLGAPIIPSSEDSLEQFMQSAGKFFGKDPSEWVQMGEPQVTVTEDQGKRYIKSTGVFSGLELHLYVEPPYFDERLPDREDRPDLNFNEKRKLITNDETWQDIIRHQPWTMSVRRQMLTAYLQAKMEADDGELAAEGCHGMWELAINKENHQDIRMERLMILLNKLESDNVQVSIVAAAAVWGLATTSSCRRMMSEIDVIPTVVGSIKNALKLLTRPDPAPGHKSEEEGEDGNGTVTETERAALQRHLIGGLAMLLVDRSCRRPYIALEPNFSTLFTLCRDLDGYRDADAQPRRETSAKILTSLMQRDPEARHSLINTGSLRNIIELLNPTGPGDTMIQFCMASLLATLVLDDEAMEMIRDRGEASVFFEACIILLTNTLDNLHAELDRQMGDYYQDDDEPAVYDLALGVRLAEAAAQAMWGSAYMCVGMTPVSVKMEHVVELGKMGMDCVATDELPLSRVCHCVTATLASMASNNDTADLLMNCPDNLALQTMLHLCEVVETENFERAGHVKASACAGIAFLTVHPLGAMGDECMVGPYRERLLSMGAFGTLLRAALTSVLDEECDMIVQQAASIGLMYMSTMAGAVDAPELAMYAALLMDSNNSEMIEFLMAGMWILLRNPDNRRCLGSSFNPNPANKIAKGMMNKLNDAITLHEINDQAQEKAEMFRQSTIIPAEEKLAPNEASAPGSVRGTSPQGDRAASAQQASEAGEQVQGDVDADLEGVQAPEDQSQGGEEEQGLEEQSGAENDVQEGIAMEVEGDTEAGDENAAAAKSESGEEATEEDRRASAGGVSSSTSRGHGSRAGSGNRAPARSRGDVNALPPGLADDESFVAEAKQRGSVSRPLSLKRPSSGTHGAQVMPEMSRAERQALEAKKELAAEKGNDLVSKFDKQLKDNWGLETLVTVGESWLPAMMEQDESGEATDVPVLKLFEFLVASICLFMIEEDSEIEPRELDLFQLTAPPGVRNRTWWTVDANAPEPDSSVGAEQERALAIMVKIVGMHLGAAWKSLQLGVLTLWNVCARNANMERHVVERGVCAKLLDIMNRAAWPASLRDIAGGCLEFFAERYTNLKFFPNVSLPAEIAWPYQKPPKEGLVPTIAGYINLINSKLPLLEYRGSHGIARICYSAPYGCPDPKEYIKEAKAVVAVLGGIDALILLMKRVNRRYQDIVMGKKTGRARHSTYGIPLTEAQQDVAVFEKDMGSLEAQQDVYFVLFAALLNVSVLRSVQPLVAKKGLLVLLGTNTMLYGHLAGGTSFVVAASGEVEEKLLHLCSSIIQNISLHPQNRTRLYKAELKGGVALDKLIEDATEAENDAELKEMSTMFPPIHGAKSEPSSPMRTANGRNRRTESPVKSNVAKTAANRWTRLSPNGAVLNESVDTSMTATVRPKVIFPPIVEQREEEVYPHRQSKVDLRGTASTELNAMGDEARAGSANGYANQGGLMVAGNAEELSGTNNSRHKFLNWMDSTFMGDDRDAGSGGGMQDGYGGRKTYRKAMWDENGDWLETEPESSKGLNRILCRPINHLWIESPEARLRQGKARWEPTVSEYKESSSDVPMTRAAAKLLATQPPRHESELMRAANQLMTTGSHGTLLEGTATTARPATADRKNGQMSLTVLKPNPDSIKAWDASQLAVPEEDAGRSPGGAEESRGRGGEGQLPPVSPGGGGGKNGRAASVPLKVCLGPKRTRQVISFENRIIVDDDASRPMLTMFEHVDGSRVCNGLFPAYQLPNGKQTFMYYKGGAMLDEVHVDAVAPPARPSTVPAALQQTMPLADVLNLISKPPGSAPPFIPYKPVPYLVPLPPRHTLTVKRPDVLRSTAFGDLREDNLQLIIQCKKIVKTQSSTKVENIELAKPEYREPWVLPNSIFKPRVKESDSHNFYDTDQTEEKMFERDWQRATAKEKFTGMLCRENKSNKSDPKDDKVMLQEVHDVLLQCYKQWYSAFMYYAGGGSGSDPYHMPLNAFTTFLDDCQIADSESQFIKRSDCDTIFIVCNFQPDKKSAEAQVNLENAMMRYEFLEAMVRAAIAKYGKGQATDDVATAVRMLLEDNVVANLPPAASVVANDFREQRLYCEEVDLLLKRHAVMLKAIYSRYRLKPAGGGLRTKVMKLEGWQQFMNDARIVDSQFTIQDAMMSFLWSRMMVVDEIKDYGRYSSFSFIDFLEALGRVADAKSLPLESELEAAGYNNILEWSLDKERLEGNDSHKDQKDNRASPLPGEDGEPSPTAADGGGHNADLFRTRDSAGFTTPKSRPLYAKLELLLDLIFRRLFWDPSQVELPFNYDNLLKLIKKIDKDLGP